MTPNRVIAGSAASSSPSVWPSRSKSRSSSVRRLGSASARNTSSSMRERYVTKQSLVKPPVEWRATTQRQGGYPHP